MTSVRHISHCNERRDGTMAPRKRLRSTYCETNWRGGRRCSENSVWPAENGDGHGVPLPPMPVGAPLRQDYFAFLRMNRVTPGFGIDLSFGKSYKCAYLFNPSVTIPMPITLASLIKACRQKHKDSDALPRPEWRLYCFCVRGRVKDYEKAISGNSAAAPTHKLSVAAE
jgi:hypothetical protein